jgi:acetyl-CoA carboxylase biotin carboxyl carrier protein
VDLARIEDLLELVARSRIAELELSENGTRIRIVKAAGAPAVAIAAPPAAVAAPADRPAMPAPAAKPAAAPTQSEIIAPTYGLFHRTPSPDAAPFTELGARVEAGQTVCIVEAMKTFIPIVAETAGTVTAILAENASEVEAGQVLFRLDAAA